MTTAEKCSIGIDALLFLLTLASVICAIVAYKHQKKRAKKETACNLAKHYAEDIIKTYSFVTSVFAKCGILDYIKNNIDFKRLHNFDKEELEQLLNEKGIKEDEFEKKVTIVDPFAVLNCRLARLDFIAERNKIYREFVTRDEESGELFLQNGGFLLNDFHQDITNLLNSLEWFSMNCIYGIADEELLYQSLHQTFLSSVWTLYFFIATSNINNENKSYTNVIALFLLWRDRLNNIVDCAERKVKKLERKEEKINSAKKKQKTKVHHGRPLK